MPQLSVQGKSRKELLGGFLRNLKSADEVLITGVSGLKVTPGVLWQEQEAPMGWEALPAQVPRAQHEWVPLAPVGGG